MSKYPKPRMRKAVTIYVCPKCGNEMVLRAGARKLIFCNKCDKWSKPPKHLVFHVKRFKCIRCGHEWTPRKANMPVLCPSCRNVAWNTPYVRPPDHPSRLRGRGFDKYVAENPNYRTPERRDTPPSEDAIL